VDIYIAEGKKLGMSRHHATIEVLEDSAILLLDQEGTNGTYVNGFRIRKKQIQENDQLKFAKYEATLGYFLKNKNNSYTVRTPLNDFSEEFQQLGGVDQELRKQIKRLSDFKGHLDFLFRTMRNIPFVVGFLFAIASFYSATIRDQLVELVQAHLYFFLIPALLYALLLFYVIYQLYAPNCKNARKEQLLALEAQHKKKYVCPRCKEYLGWDKDWTAWKRIEKHTSSGCEALFVN